MNWITSKLTAIGAAIAALALAVLRYLQVKAQRDKARKERDSLAAQVDQRNKFDEIEAEIETEYSDLQREANEDVQAGKMPDNIRNRNKY